MNATVISCARNVARPSAYRKITEDAEMTIEEYKKKFLELFKQLEEEHGPVRDVEIWKEEIGPCLTRGEIKIIF